jgi:hypothetical protein
VAYVNVRLLGRSTSCFARGRLCVCRKFIRDIKLLFCATIRLTAGNISENGNTSLVDELSEKLRALKVVAMSEL